MAMPPGTLVPRDWVLEKLDPGGDSPILATAIDLTIPALAELFGKRPSTVRAWVERGDFPGAYKLHGKEWRVPVSVVETFQDRQRRQTSRAQLSAWRRVRQSNAVVRSETGHKPVTTSSPSGNAEV